MTINSDKNSIKLAIEPNFTINSLAILSIITD